MNDMNKDELLQILHEWMCCIDDAWNTDDEQAYAQLMQIVEQHFGQQEKPKGDIEKWAEKLVNVALSIAEQSGDTQRFIKAKRFLDDFSYARPKVLFCSGHKKLQRHPNDPIQWEKEEEELEEQEGAKNSRAGK